MVLQRLSSSPRNTRTFFVAALCLVSVAACGGGKSPAQKVAAGAADAKAACQVFVTFKPPTGSSQTALANYAKAAYAAFLGSAELASRATQLDPRWSALESAADREAAAFKVVAEAATSGFSLSDRAGAAAVQRAVETTKTARATFITECSKADPAKFSASEATASPSATSSPSATASDTATASNRETPTPSGSAARSGH
ncbi:MAG TPA: hypothetical protein VHC43_04385 [Mycobacteriales bacterium]|nr:hypothetical protein [Mycobacteriales bacterium]